MTNNEILNKQRRLKEFKQTDLGQLYFRSRWANEKSWELASRDSPKQYKAEEEAYILEEEFIKYLMDIVGIK